MTKVGKKFSACSLVMRVNEIEMLLPEVNNYYESKNVLTNRTYKDKLRNVEEDNNENKEERRDETELENKDILPFVSRSFINSSFPLSQLFF
jgi:hypothetical protein